MACQPFVALPTLSSSNVEILLLTDEELTLSKEANIAAQKKMCEIINSYHFDKLNEVMAQNVKDHDPADDQGPGPEGFAHWLTRFHSAFPDFKIAVMHLVADEDNVAFAYTITGTQGGPFNGIPASGKNDQDSASTSGDAQAASILAQSTTNANGQFGSAEYSCASASSLVYLVATDGNPGLAAGAKNTANAEMAALGECGSLAASTSITSTRSRQLHQSFA